MVMRKSFLGLDLIRFCAAAMVMFYHLAYFAWLPKHGGSGLYHAAFEPVVPLVDFGWVGVEIFFVISGFVIALSAQGRLPRDFLIGRATRLYPAAWICATVTLAVLLWNGKPDWTGWVGSMLLSPAGPWIDGVYWTIVVEMVFYAWVYFLMRFAGADKIHFLGWILALLSSAFWGLRVLALLLFDVHFDQFLGLWSQLLLLEFGSFFALGIALWSAVRRGGWSRSRMALALVSLPGCLVELVAHARSVALESGTELSASPIIAWLVIMVALFTAVNRNDRIHARLGHWAGSVRQLGLATYPLYLVHFAAGREIMLMIGDPWLALALVLPGLCLLSLGIVRMEGPLRRGILWLVAPSDRTLRLAESRT
ncbi:acyltransferase [Novosphingobium sp. TH158]|uniref:acyltransferase family protein n=1 Tax=Novosphingobium sp. TH158 TaxID=2067455 RepID=UPI000C7CBF15|nr:acyltransferase [Novosphingobium sp. TH158]PLK27137.1 hypothetical protein C0V78_09750 [Novosphingobium sp. TH158]